METVKPAYELNSKCGHDKYSSLDAGLTHVFLNGTVDQDPDLGESGRSWYGCFVPCTHARLGPPRRKHAACAVSILEGDETLAGLELYRPLLR